MQQEWSQLIPFAEPGCGGPAARALQQLATQIGQCSLLTGTGFSFSWQLENLFLHSTTPNTIPDCMHTNTLNTLLHENFVAGVALREHDEIDFV